MKVFGVTGWKDAGKTGVMERLVAAISDRGFTVSTLKHAHHAFDVDQPGKDSFRHRAAGAQQVLVASSQRWALMTELNAAKEPALETLVSQLALVDLVLVEGWKKDNHPKLEVWRAETGHPLIATDDASVVAVASDSPISVTQPVLDLNDTAALADFVLQYVKLA